MEKSFTKFSRQQIKAIHKLSNGYNKLRKNKHLQVLLDLIKEHAEEISELYENKNRHFITETGDLLILCLELIKESKSDPDIVMNRCYQRYYRKLLQLTKDFQKRKR